MYWLKSNSFPENEYIWVNIIQLVCKGCMCVYIYMYIYIYKTANLHTPF